MDRKTKLGFVTFLTFVRFPLVLLFFTGALVHHRHPVPWLFTASFSALIASAVTDLFDGYFARRLGVVTTFGAHADPLMDKFFYLSTLPLLVFLSAANGHTGHAVFLLCLTMLFLTRDQWVTFLRALGSLCGVRADANWSGKLRTGVTFPLIGAIYYVEAAPRPIVGYGFLYAFESAALLINVVSLFVYTRRYWPCLHRAAGMNRVAEDARPNAD